jgi:hypothetical protein
MHTETIDLNDSWIDQDALHAMNKFVQFALETFKNATASSCIRKLKEEIDELVYEVDLNPIKDREKQMIEYVDCIMCLLNSAARIGILPSDLMQAFREKLLINKQREWKQNPDGTYSHVKKIDPRFTAIMDAENVHRDFNQNSTQIFGSL